jgi:hypothetical protein
MSTTNILFWASIFIFFGNIEAVLEVGFISSIVSGLYYITPEFLSESFINYFYKFQEYIRHLLRRLFISILETPDNTTPGSPTTSSPNKYEIVKTITKQEEIINEKKGVASYWKYIALATVIIITIGGVVIYLYLDIFFGKGDQGGGQQNIINSDQSIASLSFATHKWRKFYF